MGGEKAEDLSFNEERKDWLFFRKKFRKFFDEKNMGWAITAGASLSKFFLQKAAENAAAAKEDEWEVMPQDLDSFHEDTIYKTTNNR